MEQILSVAFHHYLRRGMLLVTFVFLVGYCCFAQTGQVSTTDLTQPRQAIGNLVKLRIKAALVDNDLNVKPIPKLKLLLISTLPQSNEIVVTTNFDGVVEVNIAAGSYDLKTAQPVQFQGRQYSWVMTISVPPQGATFDLSVDNAHIEQVAAPSVSRKTDELTTLFQRFQSSVVTVWSEFGHGTGFLVDQAGLFLTNQHVIGPSEYIAVQIDSKRKLAATLLYADSDKDVAVLWANLSDINDLVLAPIAKTGGSEPTVVEGERVFTIGSPLNQRKIMTTGIVSKVEKRAIISDININPGNSGGPLFNSLGFVVGLTTFGESTKQGPGISGIIRIEEALPVLEAARQKMSGRNPPSPALLPVEPEGDFPLYAIKASLQQSIEQKHFYEEVIKPNYILDAGDYNVAIITPPVKYYMLEQNKLAAAREKAKRTGRQRGAVQGTFQPLDDLKNWAEYAGQYKPVLEIRAQPKLRETAGSAWSRALISPYLQAKVRFKTDFYKMTLKCGSRDIQPIHPGKIANIVNVQNRFINATDATYEGYYIYPANAISSDCQTVTLELFSEKKPDKAKIVNLESRSVERVVEDFAPYNKK